MFRVLQSYKQNTEARRELQRRGISFWPERAPRSLRDRIRGMPPLEVGELNKSWELLETLDCLDGHIQRTDAILDLGCFASEILCVLHKAGYRNLSGIDLNPRVVKMPFSNHIRYIQGDMMKTGLAAGSFSAVLAMSSIEHGLHLHALLAEVSRLLKAGGLLIGSTDYWPSKIDTSGIKMFDMDWRIFCEQEIRSFFQESARYGLHALGDLDLKAADDCIDSAGKTYTFGWFALRKT